MTSCQYTHGDGADALEDLDTAPKQRLVFASILCVCVALPLTLALLGKDPSFLFITILGPLGALLGPLGIPWGSLGILFGSLGGPLGGPWGPLGIPWESYVGYKRAGSSEAGVPWGSPGSPGSLGLCSLALALGGPTPWPSI